MSDFKDHFSDVSPGYAAYRPHYPEGLFDYLAGLTRSHDCAWDCATGTGQAASALAGRFDRVVATDASNNQISNARRHPGISFRVAPAESSGLVDGSQDLITVAQALHWFDLARFYVEVRRVLKPGGILAAWTYNLFRTTPALDRVVESFYHGKLADHWPAERIHVENGYRDLPFPPGEIDPPYFCMQASWSLEHLLGYLNTWSAVKRYNQDTQGDAVGEIERELRSAWPSDRSLLQVEWPLMLRIARLD